MAECSVKKLFEPASVAIIGASENPGKIGYNVLRNLVESGYKGKIYPINPKGGSAFGINMYKSIEEVPGEVDLVTITIPAKLVLGAVKQCAQKKVKFLSIITSGFSEVGNTAEEKEMVEIARASGMRILGPNIFGIYSANASMNATFASGVIDPGGVAILTQSGALGIAMIGKTKVENIGLSAMVSIGNKCDIDESDLLEYLIDDPKTKAIMMYMEGVKGGQKLIKTLKKVTKVKPVVVIKSGRSKRGAAAAASHTGSLAGADNIFDAVMKQCNVHRAYSIGEALDWCKFLAEAPQVKGENAVIITNGGGIGVLAADACEQYGINLDDDLAKLKEAFAPVTPSFGSLKNPIDITGGAGMADYEKCIRTAFERKDIHSIIILGCETAVLDGNAMQGAVEAIFKDHKNTAPAVYSFVGGEGIENGIHALKKKGVAIYNDVGPAIACLAVAVKNYRNLHKPPAKEVTVKQLGVDVATIKSTIAKAKADNRNFLLADEAQVVMKACGITMPQSQLATSPEQAVSLAEKMGYPVVMKIVSKDIIHKSDAGGVALNIKSADEVKKAYANILERCKKYKADAVIKGIEVVEMIRPGVETIVGGRIDPSFGPVVMFGQGGIYVEVMKDIAFRALTLDPQEVDQMIQEIKAYPLLKGVRGEKRRDIAKLNDAILRVAAVLQECPEITDIEINPLVAYPEGEGVRAVDARILVK